MTGEIRKRVHFFDVDHTIIRGSSGPIFLLEGIKRGIFSPLSLALFPWFFVRFYLGTLSSESGKWDFSLLAGKTRDSLEEVARENLRRLRAIIYPEARLLIERIKENGKTLVLATTSLEIIVRPLAEYLGIDEVIATELEFDGRLCTGRFIDGPLLKERKREKVFEFLQARSVDWRDCAFYSDSIYDLSLLEAVAEPVVVNPDHLLRRVARKKGWPVLKFR